MSLTPLLAQETSATAIPHLLRFTGTFHPANGLPAGPTESATLSVYAEEQGGTPLWQETQNVTLDADGHYMAVLGTTQNEGVPIDLFRANSPRWLGVMFNRPGETEQARVQLVSVPYAMRASDAETLGGLPASAYLLDPNAPATGNANSGTTTPTSSASGKSLKPRTISGNMNYIPYFTDNSNDLGNSVLYQSGGKVGIGTTIPSNALVVGNDIGATATPGSAVTIGGTSSNSVLTIGQSNANRLRVQWRYNPTPGGAYAALGTNGGNPLILQDIGGNVGIGPTIPSNALVVGNDIGATATPASSVAIGSTSSNSVLTIGQSNANRLRLQWVYNSTPGSAYAALATNGGNPLILQDVGGNVGIGASPSSKLDVSGDINFSGIIRYLTNPAFSLIRNNTAAGSNALASISTLNTGDNNTAVGSQALTSDTAGTSNTGIGYFALKTNADGNQNTAVGAQSLEDTVGTSNGSEGSGNTAVGWGALQLNQTGNSNIAIGLGAGSSLQTGSNNIDIGNTGVSTSESGTVRIGTSQTSFFVAGVRGATTGNNDAIAVVIDSNGQLGTISSSRRFKEDIQDMGEGSSGLMRLRPVTFRYRKPFADGSKPIQYGLIAEEVEEVYPDLVAHSADGQIETVKYQVLDSMLLNEVQKQENRIGQQQEHIERLEEQNRSLQERLEKLESAMAAGSR